MVRVKPLFAYSRHPIDVLLAGERDERRWFLRNADVELKRFIRQLRAHGDVTRAELRTSEQTTHDELGAYATFYHQLEIHFRDYGPITCSGSGHARERTLARAIGYAELLERLAIEIHFGAVQDNTAIGHAIASLVVDWSSNGASFHSSAVEVVKGALCEVLERDAFLTSWYAGRALPTAPIERGHPAFALAQRLDKRGWQLREHAWKHDRVDAACVYLSAIRRQPRADGWNFFLGCGAAPTHRDAVGKATNELLRMFRVWQASYDQLDQSEEVTPEALGNVLSRLVIYQRPEYIREFERMTSARPVATARALRPASDRAFVVDCMRALGDVRIIPLPVPVALRENVFVIKAVSQQLQNVDWDTPPKFNVARIRGRYGRARLNRFPHPIA